MKTMMAILRIADIKKEYIELRDRKSELESEYIKLERLHTCAFKDRCLAAKYGDRTAWQGLAVIAQEYEDQLRTIGGKIGLIQLEMHALAHDYTVLVTRHKLIESMDYPYHIYD